MRRSFPEGGYYILGEDFGAPDEVKLIADAGPLGFLAIAAHGHADALSLVLSVAGREILTDSGTYSYHTEREWRDFFKGTAAHTTVRIDELDQSTAGGTFLWTRHAQARCEEFVREGAVQRWRAHHDGYLALPDPVKHTRELLYRESQRTLQVTDSLTAKGRHTIELLWHFSETCVVEQRGDSVVAQDSRAVVTITPPGDLAIELVKGATAPPQGWISRQFGARRERVTAVCRGAIRGDWQGVTQLQIALV
jgi:hypothetical protein